MALPVTSNARLSQSGASPPPARGKEPKECPERQKEIKMHFLHACWDSVFLHVLGWVLEANLEFQLSLSHLKEVGRDVLTGGKLSHRTVQPPDVMDILSDADAVECGPFVSGSKFESQV